MPEPPSPSSPPSPPVLSPPLVSASFTTNVLDILVLEIPFTFLTCAVSVIEEDGSPSSTYNKTPDFVFSILVYFEILFDKVHVTLL